MAKPNSERLWELWMAERARAESKGEEPWLGWPIISFSYKRVILAGCLQLASNLLSFANPLIMMEILKIVEGTPAIVPVEQAWVLAIIRTTGVMVQVILNNHYGNIVNRISFRIRMAVVGALFKKSTALSTGSKAAYSAGEIVNMMSNDANRCQNLINQVRVI